MGHFSIFWAIFQHNFGDSRDIHGMRPIILGYFYDGNKYISFQEFSQLKTMGIMKIHFGHRVGKYDP